MVEWRIKGCSECPHYYQKKDRPRCCLLPPDALEGYGETPYAEGIPSVCPLLKQIVIDTSVVMQPHKPMFTYNTLYRGRRNDAQADSEG